MASWDHDDLKQQGWCSVALRYCTSASPSGQACCCKAAPAQTQKAGNGDPAVSGDVITISPPGSVVLATQVGGDHYTDMAIQPLTYVLANNLGFVEGAVIKYVSRWKRKGGVEDLEKARDMLDKLIAHEKGKKQA